ncbi:Gamma-aminobutyric acid receptor subunit beta-3 [Holothuria leucospilota]|uniref:Gamma-aminobutyric acid receptor subunit beta-3 n=1 Tax=Holothuria leucospilota TaxID=206669 RepID=A0A9Q1BJR7_HOLLE|nr:Gamma-aminobutyric acid receptor subunit beta-3 [Holothuria leucospilota]
MYLRQHWRDERLAYDSTYGNVSVDGRLADRIWVPDTYLVNDKRSLIHDVTVKNRLLRFHHDGTIMYGIRMTTVAACMMDLRNYPMDEQNCTLELESYGYTTDDITFTWQYGDESIEGFENIEMPQFALVEYDLNARNTVSAGSYPRLSMSFRIRRNIGFFILQTYLPSILIVILSWVSFWINHEATAARVALGITTVLTMTTISTSVRATLPRISYIKSIDIYVVTCFAFVFAALLEYAVVNFNHWAEKRKQMDNDSSRKNYHGYIPVSQNESPARRRILNSDDDDDEWSDGEVRNSSFRSYQYSQTNSPCRLRGRKNGKLRHAWLNLGRRHQRRKKKRRRPPLPNIKNVDSIDSMSRILFPVGFILFNVVYWFSYLKIFYGSEELPAMVQF